MDQSALHHCALSAITEASVGDAFVWRSGAGASDNPSPTARIAGGCSLKTTPSRKSGVVQYGVYFLSQPMPAVQYGVYFLGKTLRAVLFKTYFPGEKLRSVAFIGTDLAKRRGSVLYETYFPARKLRAVAYGTYFPGGRRSNERVRLIAQIAPSFNAPAVRLARSLQL